MYDMIIMVLKMVLMAYVTFSVIDIATSFDDLPLYQMHNLLQSSFVADAITDTLKHSVQIQFPAHSSSQQSHKVGQKTSLLSSQSGEKAETAQ